MSLKLKKNVHTRTGIYTLEIHSSKAKPHWKKTSIINEANEKTRNCYISRPTDQYLHIMQ